MPLHFLDDVNAVEAISEQLASLSSEVESWDRAHKLLHGTAATHKPAFTIDGCPEAVHCLHLSLVEPVCSGGHRLLHDKGYHPKTERMACSMLLTFAEFEARQYKQ